jgi:hypothetical protein
MNKTKTKVFIFTSPPRFVIVSSLQFTLKERKNDMNASQTKPIALGGDTVPAGTFHGGDTVPAGTFRGGDTVPAGTFHTNN